jgi:hypothetical protein
LQEHALLTHVWPSPQFMPLQMHLPRPHMPCAPHAALEHRQWPELHVNDAGHALVQPPQWAVSLSTGSSQPLSGLPSQSAVPGTQYMPMPPLDVLVDALVEVDAPPIPLEVDAPPTPLEVDAPPTPLEVDAPPTPLDAELPVATLLVFPPAVPVVVVADVLPEDPVAFVSSFPHAAESAARARQRQVRVRIG